MTVIYLNIYLKYFTKTSIVSISLNTISFVLKINVYKIYKKYIHIIKIIML
jgi:hypothetical protein